MPRGDWPSDQLDALRRLWGEGKTALEISNLLPGEHRSRSAVIGKARRLGLESRPHPVNRVPPPPPRTPPPSARGMRAFDLMDDLIADENFGLREAAEAAGVPIDRAREHFHALRNRYDYGIRATAIDDAIAGPERPVRMGYVLQ